MSESRITGESGRKADHSEIINRILDELEAQDAYQAITGDHSLNWDDPDDRAVLRRQFDNAREEEAMLPGFGQDGLGSNARDDCGESHPFACDSCGHYVEFGRTCSQSVCNRCGVAWTRDSAIKKAAKLRRIRKEKDWNTPDAMHQKFHHLIISPSAGWYYALAKAGLSLEEAQDVTLDVVKDLLDEMRAQGLLIRHSYRGKKDDGSIRSESDDLGYYKTILNEEDRKWVGDVRDELAWKPHYHCMVVSDWVKTYDFTEHIEESTGWVFHRIQDDEGRSVRTDGHMARATMYSLSHLDVRAHEDRHNQNIARWVGRFGEDRIKSSSRFVATPADLRWADQVVRESSWEILGLNSSSTDCGVTLPGVDEPDELARRILEELYPEEPETRREISTDAVLHHVSEGNIRVDVETTSGAGGSVRVLGFSKRLGLPGSAGDLPSRGPSLTGSAGSLPSARSETTVGDSASSSAPTSTDHSSQACDDGCSCGAGDDVQDDEPEECAGTLVPLGEIRARGLLEDPEWCKEAAHVEEVREADLEWDDDLERWRTKQPGSAIGVA